MIRVAPIVRGAGGRIVGIKACLLFCFLALLLSSRSVDGVPRCVARERGRSGDASIVDCVFCSSEVVECGEAGGFTLRSPGVSDLSY